jgi:hypothetical protein
LFFLGTPQIVHGLQANWAHATAWEAAGPGREIFSRCRPAELNINTARRHGTNPWPLANATIPFRHLRAIVKSNFFPKEGFRFTGGICMTRPDRLGFAFALLLSFTALPALAQSSAGVPAPRSTAPGSTTTPGSTAPANNRRGRQQPCWQSAGISQQVVQQHRQIEENMRSQVESVCANSSLSPQQKREQIRQIREQGRKQIEGLITPQQEEALKACREQRGGGRGENHGGGGMHRGSGEGPCGEIPAGNGRPNGTRTQPQNESQSEPQ